MFIYTETEGISIKIVNGVEMLKESVTNEEKVLVLTWESAFMDNEVTFLMTGFVQVLFWVDLEDIVTHLETDWLKFRGNVFATVLDVAESLVRSAIEIWKGLLPLKSNFLKNVWWNRKLGTTSVDDGWIGSVFTWLLHRFLSVVHALTLESPGS